MITRIGSVQEDSVLHSDCSSVVTVLWRLTIHIHNEMLIDSANRQQLHKLLWLGALFVLWTREERADELEDVLMNVLIAVVVQSVVVESN